MAHVTANEQGAKYIPAFSMAKVFFKNTTFRTHKSAFRLGSKLCGLPLAAMSNGKGKKRTVTFSLVSWGWYRAGRPVSTQNKSII